MLATVFYFILNMSLVSCFVIAALLLIRQIRALPSRVIYPLWSLAFFRLLMPFTLPTSWSLFNFTGGLVKQLISVETITLGTAPVPDSGGLWAMNVIGAAEQYAPVAYKTEALRQSFTTASMLWAIIAAAAFLIVILFYRLTGNGLQKAIHLKGNLYRSDLLLSPILFGIFRPKMILPESLDPDSEVGHMVLAHEEVHRRRLDNLWRLLGIGVVCLHWFNPLVWVMLKMFLTDMERSCDEAVVKNFNAEKRKIYAGALLRFAEGKRYVSTAFGHSGVKVRIIHVLHYKKLTHIGVIASSLFLLVLALVLLTNPYVRG